MPSAAPRPCRITGCRALVADGTGYCPAHKRAALLSFADPSRGSRHERGYGTRWDVIRERILLRDAGMCQECLRNGVANYCAGKRFGAYVDHITPRAQGGTDDDENLQTLCRACHTVKTDREKNVGRGGRKSQTPIATGPSAQQNF